MQTTPISSRAQRSNLVPPMGSRLPGSPNTERRVWGALPRHLQGQACCAASWKMAAWVPCLRLCVDMPHRGRETCLRGVGMAPWRRWVSLPYPPRRGFVTRNDTFRFVARASRPCVTRASCPRWVASPRPPALTMVPRTGKPPSSRAEALAMPPGCDWCEVRGKGYHGPK